MKARNSLTSKVLRHFNRFLRSFGVSKLENHIRKGVPFFLTFLLVLTAGASLCHAESYEEYFGQGNKAYAQKNYNQAISNYTLAIGLNPSKYEVYFNRGNAYLENDKLGQAIQDYSNTININPQFFSAYNNRAYAYFLQDKFQKSWEEVKKLRALGGEPDPSFLEKLTKATEN